MTAQTLAEWEHETGRHRYQRDSLCPVCTRHDDSMGEDTLSTLDSEAAAAYADWLDLGGEA